MNHDIRLLSADDTAAAWALGSLAFGYHNEPIPPDWSGAGRPGRSQWGVFGEGGRLLAKAVDREQAHWFGGKVVAASGVAGVAVAADVRGSGLGRILLTRLLAEARERGAAISTLFPTTPVPYRRLGWEEVGTLVKTAVPAMLFEALRLPPGITTRAATVDDVPAIREIYLTAARAGAGMMDRSGPAFASTPDELLAEWNGVTVAVRDGSILGYSTWDRGSGYDASGRLFVGDLIAETAEATTALLAVLGQWGSVAPTLIFRHGGPDPVHLLSGLTIHGRIEQRQPWMLRLVDAAAAIAARGWSPYVSGSVDVELVDEVCPWNSGAFQFAIEDGRARWEPGGNGRVRLTARGVAAWYAGAASPDVLRRAGLLEGPTEHDAFLLAASAGPPPTLLDHF
jgi:predicted acetyltransferase